MHICELGLINFVGTVCRKCIYDKFTIERLRSCPVCNVDLGGVPLDKLRYCVFFSYSPIIYNLVLRCVFSSVLILACLLLSIYVCVFMSMFCPFTIKYVI